ncbi:PepSY domain-containing protein [Bradyrhizobium jicamae]|uniref:PepSY domain-containing protein n=1 Tax=Bradyrhizobium jicamae TaxID=280332 RepID=A0ABS5FU42_9BRAD|nr:PepSY domain-containing protein [Bradyrhizobium jicamae]MBR0799801.1 PepSY domain-containing protein [Bradyrhizobium jicamae]
MSRLTLLAATLLLLASAPVGAQSQPAQKGPNNNAVNSSDQNNSKAPVAGRNSFTEGQAKSRIEAAGYSNVSGLQKDDEGVWRGKADKSGTKTDVSVDFQGNVNPAQ